DDDHYHARHHAHDARARSRRRTAGSARDRRVRRAVYGDRTHAARDPDRLRVDRGVPGATHRARSGNAAACGAAGAGRGARPRTGRFRAGRRRLMIRAFIRRPIAVSMIYLVVAALGFAAFRNVPIELLPDTDLPRLQVSAQWPGSSAEVIEAFLTAPLEAAIQQVRGVETITSTSSESGGAVISVEFARETDMDFARLELSERIASLEPDLPVGSSPPRVTMYIPDEFRDQQQSVLRYTVTGPYILEYLREFIDDHVVPELHQVEGVGSIQVSGGRARVLEIELDERKIQALGLSLQEVSARVSQMEIIREAGAVAAPGGLHYTLAVRQTPQTADDVADLPLLTNAGRLVRVADVARVYDTFEEMRQHYRIDGNPAVGMQVYKQPRSNTVAMAHAVRTEIDELSTALPPGMRIILDS